MTLNASEDGKRFTKKTHEHIRTKTTKPVRFFLRYGLCCFKPVAFPKQREGLGGPKRFFKTL